MLKVNSVDTKTVVFNNQNVHKVVLNGVTVFDDQCYVTWNVVHLYQGSVGQAWESYLSISNIFRKDTSTPVSGSVTATVVTTTNEGGVETRYYNSPLNEVEIASGGTSEIGGAASITIKINNNVVHVWNYHEHHSSTIKSGIEYFYMS